jgi:hypothetical protein
MQERFARKIRAIQLLDFKQAEVRICLTGEVDSDERLFYSATGVAITLTTEDKVFQYPDQLVFLDVDHHSG